MNYLADNVMHFARVLRAAGMRVGTDRVAMSLQALQVAGLASRRDFQATLAACLLDRAEHRLLFDQAFHIFWRDPDLLGRAMAMLLPRVDAKAGLVPPPPENRRLADALFPHAPPPKQAPEPPEEIEADARLTWSERELLRQRDFETMTTEEWAEAKRVLQGLQPFFEALPTRRQMPSPRGRIDWRSSLRAQGRNEAAPLQRQMPKRKVAPLIVLADISGSMSRYSRMLLHLAHGLSNPAMSQLRRRLAPTVSSFVFGTRLTPISRLMKQRDPDLAVAAVARAVADWSGGTRLAACLHTFNKHWARRVMSSDATVLLITDGLEQGGAPDQLAFEAQRLRLACRRLIWLNPLLRFDGFEPTAAGVRALLPEVTMHLPAHNLASLEDLTELLSSKRSNKK